MVPFVSNRCHPLLTIQEIGISHALAEPIVPVRGGGDLPGRRGGRTQSRLRSALLSLLRRKRIGTAAAALTGLAGAKELSRKISTMCGYVPATVEIQLPEHLSGHRFLMNGAHGKDPVARSLWWGGWAGFERPFPDLFAACSQSSRCVLDGGSFSG